MASKFRSTEAYAERRAELLDHAADAKRCFSGRFTGPSEHFHVRALTTRKEARSSDRGRDACLELIYATLVSWGMHRMGEAGAKMTSWHDFHEGVLAEWSSIERLWDCGPLTDDAAWDEILAIYRALRVSRSACTLVAHSKTLAHLLPGVIAPIDRQYTLRFLGQHGAYEYGKKRAWDDGALAFEFELLREHHQQFFYPLIADERFTAATAGWAEPMCSTPLKAADSLIVGYEIWRRGGVEPADS